MFVLDTDTLTHLLMGHRRVTEKREGTTAEVALTIITRIEVLQGRFAALLKAEDGEKLLLANQRLSENEKDLGKFLILRFDEVSGTEFDRLRQNKKIKVRRCDLLIAAITLANRATLVTRNSKDFRKVPGLRIENWVD